MTTHTNKPTIEEKTEPSERESRLGQMHHRHCPACFAREYARSACEDAAVLERVKTLFSIIVQFDQEPLDRAQVAAVRLEQVGDGEYDFSELQNAITRFSDFRAALLSEVLQNSAEIYTAPAIEDEEIGEDEKPQTEEETASEFSEEKRAEEAGLN